MERRARPARRAKPPAPARTGAAGLPFLFKPGFLLFLGSLLLGLLWAGGLFGSSSAAAGTWPWDVFRSGEDGSFALRWDGVQVYVLLGAFMVAFFLLASLFPSSRGRSMAVLTVAALALVPFGPGMRPLLFAGAALLGLGGGALLARSGAGAGRGLLFVALVLVAANLLFPIGPQEAYASQAWDLGQDLFGDRAGGDVGAVLMAPRNALLLMLALLLLLLLLAWLGAGGAWMTWVGGLALLVGVFAPLVLTYLDFAKEASDASWELALRTVTRDLASRVGALVAFALPVAAGVIDGARRDLG